MSSELNFVTVDTFNLQNEHMAVEQMQDRRRIYQLECQVEELLNTIKQFEKSLIENGFKETMEGKATRLYNELENRSYMKTSDVRIFFEFEHYAQAGRVMDRANELFDDVQIVHPSKRVRAIERLDM